MSEKIDCPWVKKDPALPFLEQIENDRIYNLCPGKERPLNVFEMSDPLELCKPEQGCNKTPNPIMHSIAHPKNGLSRAVYALIEPHHLDTGEMTVHNRELANKIRQLKGKANDGPTVAINHRVGHIISHKLGGKMEKKNLFPVSCAPDIEKLTIAEKVIYNFVNENKAINGRAYMRMFLHFEDDNHPHCPTRLEYSYSLFSDKDAKQNLAGGDVHFMVYVPDIRREIPIINLGEDWAFAAPKFDRASQRVIDNVQARTANKQQERDKLQALINATILKGISLAQELSRSLEGTADGQQSAPGLSDRPINELNLQDFLKVLWGIFNQTANSSLGLDSSRAANIQQLLESISSQSSISAQLNQLSIMNNDQNSSSNTKENEKERKDK